MADYTILIIDYNPRSVDLIRAPLEQAGYRVEVAADGISGLSAFEKLEPDLTMVEAMLPKKHGFEVCQELKATNHGRLAPVMIVTGVYRGQKYRNQAKHQHGCDGYLEKPVTDAQLLAAVREFLPQQSSESPEAAVAGSSSVADAATRGEVPDPPPAEAPQVEAAQVEAAQAEAPQAEAAQAEASPLCASVAADGSLVRDSLRGAVASPENDVPPDYDDAELEIINQLDTLFADDASSPSTPDDDPRDASAKI